ncbi:hypothetical protein GY45DRAFT_1114447 [Cubamyces sp. BRFM 1775]|nr:hypothetical protein GY45DRAFT_1114447 [Cubamyces sp. BRFM 1775]
MLPGSSPSSPSHTLTFAMLQRARTLSHVAIPALFVLHHRNDAIPVSAYCTISLPTASVVPSLFPSCPSSCSHWSPSHLQPPPPPPPIFLHLPDMAVSVSVFSLGFLCSPRPGSAPDTIPSCNFIVVYENRLFPPPRLTRLLVGARAFWIPLTFAFSSLPWPDGNDDRTPYSAWTSVRLLNAQCSRLELKIHRCSMQHSITTIAEDDDPCCM